MHRYWAAYHPGTTSGYAALGTVRVGGQPLTFKRSGNGFFSLDFGQPNLHDQPDAVAIAGEPGPGRSPTCCPSDPSASRAATAHPDSQPQPSPSRSRSNGSGGRTRTGPSTYSGPFPEPPAQS
jgi:hypothetical protein